MDEDFYPPCSMGTARGKNLFVCANRARHSLHGEAFTGLIICGVCEALLLPKVGYDTLWRMNLDDFSPDLGEVDSPHPEDEPELWRPYPSEVMPSPQFDRSPVCIWIPVDCDSVWEVPFLAVSDGAWPWLKLTTWTHAKKVLNKYKYVELAPKPDADPYKLELDYFGKTQKIRYRGPLAVGREATWWYFRADKYHWRRPIADIMHEYGKDSSFAHYLEFRHQFDPWWHDNKTPPKMHDEYCRIRGIWELYREVPWQEDQWPITPPKIPLGANDESTKGEYEAKCKGYQALCASLRRKFWRDDRLIEKPEECWKAIRDIQSNKRNGTWKKGQIMKKQKRK
jgi:hypothetical protein